MSCIVFTGGGTGGHIFPGIAVAEVLKNQTNKPIVWIGSNKGSDRSYVNAASIPFYGIPAGKLRRYLSIQNIIDVFKVTGGFFASLIILLRLKPDFIFSKGGFVSVPPCAAAWCLRIPVITHECDFSPGLATKITGTFASNIFTSYTATSRYFPPSMQNKITCTGNPVRMSFYTANPVEGKKSINYSGDKPILFVQGGSLGAAQINLLIERSILFLTEHFFVVHQTGSQHVLHGERIKAFLEKEAPQQRGNYQFFPFISEQMPNILACSSLVVSRAGANTLWEASAAGKPLILIPLDTGSSRGDQVENAAFFEQAGAACVLKSAEASPECLCSELSRLLENPAILDSMSSASASLSAAQPAVKIADILKYWVKK